MPEVDGFRYILHCIDYFSRFHWLAPLKRKTTEETHDALRPFFGLVGLPDILLSDNGTEFANLEALVAEFPAKCSVRHGPPYEPQVQGMVERYNAEVRKKMASFHDDKWYKHLSHVTSMYIYFHISFISDFTDEWF
jgi:transposase InsO family protein